MIFCYFSFKMTKKKCKKITYLPAHNKNAQLGNCKQIFFSGKINLYDGLSGFRLPVSNLQNRLLKNKQRDFEETSCIAYWH